MTEQIRDIFGPIFPGSEEDSSQDAAQSFAAVTTVVGIKYLIISSLLKTYSRPATSYRPHVTLWSRAGCDNR